MYVEGADKNQNSKNKKKKRKKEGGTVVNSVARPHAGTTCLDTLLDKSPLTDNGHSDVENNHR